MQNDSYASEALIVIAGMLVALFLVSAAVLTHDALKHPYHPFRQRLDAYRDARALKRRNKDDEAFWVMFDRYKQNHSK